MKKMIFTAVLAGAALFAACSGKSTSGVRMGSLSTFDSLSYAFGANIAGSVNYQMGDIPFDMKAVAKGVEEAALGKSSLDHDQAIELLQDYFMNKRGERARAVAEKRAAADSARMAEGDSTRVEYPRADEAMFESEKEREEISYAFGNDIGFNVAQMGMPIQVVWINKAMEEASEGKARMNDMEAQQYLQYHFTVKVPAENKAASEKWLAEVEKRSGVQKTGSGLLYKVVEAGDMEAKANDPRDEVAVHYVGRTREGKVFDASKFENFTKERQEMVRKSNPALFDEKGNLKEAEEPARFALNRVIPGWTEGMQLVGKGGKIILWIPAELAYGSRGAGRDIGPNEALEFEVELIDVVPFVEPAPAAEEEAPAK